MEKLAEQQDFAESEETMAVQKVIAQGRSLLANDNEGACFVSERSWDKVLL